MVRMDITDIPVPTSSVDVVLCSHVLEHIPEDERALLEIRRILRPSGWAVLLVPIGGAKTDEDASITDPQERTTRFGQHDHVRIYGMDLVGKLERAGFAVECVHISAVVSKSEARRLALPETEPPVFFCRPS